MAFAEGVPSLVVADIGTLLSEDTDRGRVLRVIPTDEGFTIEVIADGLGRLSHIDVADLWIQQSAKEGKVQFRKLPSTENTSEKMAKPVEGGV